MKTSCTSEEQCSVTRYHTFKQIAFSQDLRCFSLGTPALWINLSQKVYPNSKQLTTIPPSLPTVSNKISAPHGEGRAGSSTLLKNICNYFKQTKAWHLWRCPSPETDFENRIDLWRDNEPWTCNQHLFQVYQLKHNFAARVWSKKIREKTKLFIQKKKRKKVIMSCHLPM